jgi:ribulose-bisphosphate carboxylase large chain
MKKKPEAPSCEWKMTALSPAGRKGTRILRHRGAFRWTSVPTERYKDEDGTWSAITRHVLVGDRGETAKFHLRYFEIAPGGHSSLERHRHEHVVVCVRGRGGIILGKRIYTIGYLDTVYIAPDTIHQLRNPHGEPFGFLCIVNAKRDRPKPVKEK